MRTLKKGKELNSSEIQELLHHRSPYLLLDEVKSITKTEIQTVKLLTGDEYFFQGHFPGAPILPGAMMQEMTTQTAGILLTKFYSPVPNYNSNTTKGHAIGVLKKINFAKYKKFAKPGDQLEIKADIQDQFDNIFEFQSTITINKNVIMKNSFQLINISDQHLF